METKLRNSVLTPCGLVLLALPAVFLSLPDGVPFVYAGCASVAAGTAYDPSVQCWTCLEEFQTGSDYVMLWDCTVTPTVDPSEKCEITANATFRIDKEDCIVMWEIGCSGFCDDDPLLEGAVTSQVAGRTHGCSANNDMITITFFADRISCNDCENDLGFSTLLIAEAQCSI